MKPTAALPPPPKRYCAAAKRWCCKCPSPCPSPRWHGERERGCASVLKLSKNVPRHRREPSLSPQAGRGAGRGGPSTLGASGWEAREIPFLGDEPPPTPQTP